MGRPAFLSTRKARKRRDHCDPSSSSPSSHLQPDEFDPPASQIKSATRTRLIFSLSTSLLSLVALIFLILAEAGNTSATEPIVGSIYFIKLDMSHVIPRTVPKARLINSIARTLGLHDFYQVGLWNYCEGYHDEITGCSRPRTLYWFNPVQIILSELLSGATIALPSTIVDALKLVRLASHWMFGLFLTGTCMSFLSVFLTPLSVYTRWATLPIAIYAFLTALTITAATVIATAMFVIFRKVIHGAGDTVNIIPQIGTKMFAFVWMASACTILAWLVQMGLCCCCASRRDVTRMQKTGRNLVQRQNAVVPPMRMGQEKGGQGRLIGRKVQ